MEQPKKDIVDQLQVFVYRKWLFIIPLIIGAIAGLVTSFELDEKYSSSTLILVEEQQVPEEYVTPTDRTPFSQRLNVISQQILSRTRLEQIIKEFKLYEYQDPGRFERAVAFVTGSEIEERTPEDIIEQMRADIQFMVIGEPNAKKTQNSGGNAFTITYSGNDPQTAMQVTNTLASLFIEENLRVREQYAEGTSEFISSELEKAQEELAKFEQRIKDFKQSNMGTLPEQLEANLRTLDRLQLEDRRVVLEEQMRAAPSAVASPAVKSSLAGELESARSELSQMLSRFKDNYPDVIILKKRILDLETQLGAQPPQPSGEKKASPSVLNPAYAELMAVRSQLTTLRQRDDDIRRNIADYEKRVETTPSVEQQQKDLMRDYQISLENYQGLLGKKMNARLAENLEKRQKGARFRVVDPANLPESPAYPNKPLVTGIGLAGGAAAGAGFVFLFEFLNPAFRKPEDFEGIIDAPVLSSIPLFHKDDGGAEQKLRLVKGKASA